MTVRGQVKNGVVVLEEPTELPEGAQVEVSLIDRPKDDPSPEPPRTLYERLEPFIGKAKGLPPDLAQNHDHYLYGLPKRQ